MGVLLGFDFGPRKIGIAVGQTITKSASPLITLRAKAKLPDWMGIKQLIRLWDPDALVVGIPYNLDDTEADLAPRANRFAQQLAGRFLLPVYKVDERLTSREARRLIGNSAKTSDAVDAVAALLILETWFSEQR